MARKKNGSLQDLQRTTDLLSSLLVQQARNLDARQRQAGGEGDMKALKEITAVLKDLAAVARTLSEQGGESDGPEYGVVLLPPVEPGKEERKE